LIRTKSKFFGDIFPGRAACHGAECDLIELVQREQNRLVLKPNDDYGGHGVFLGWETEADDWERAIALALERPYVVQERVPMKKFSMPAFSDRVRMEEMFIDFNPFLFNNEPEGALIRLSSSSLLNVTSGGGQTALLVLEDMYWTSNKYTLTVSRSRTSLKSCCGEMIWCSRLAARCSL
jgi:hypothetical protein